MGKEKFKHISRICIGVAHSLAQQAFLGPNQISMEETTPIILFVINQSFSNNIHYFCQQKKKKN
jgi:hypothetical protein